MVALIQGTWLYLSGIQADKAQLAIFYSCEVVQADGSVLGSAINCVVLALLDAGVAMRGVLVAITCVVFDDGDQRTRRQRRQRGQQQGCCWIRTMQDCGPCRGIVLIRQC